MSARLAVEVCYARPDEQRVIRIRLEPGTTLRQAIERSGILREFPEIDLPRCGVGVFGRPRALEDAVSAGDRIEIYRPLLADPKEIRRRRAAESRRKDLRKV